MRSFLTTTAVAVATLVTTSGIVAFADPANANVRSSDTPDLVVQIGDLDLHSDAGHATAERRIRNAADGACGSSDMRDLNAVQCRDEAIDAANRALEAHLATR